MTSEWAGLLAGFIAGWLNTVAGGGSGITLAWLAEAGLDVREANATNRIGVLMQASVATATLWHAGRVPWKACAALLPTALVGAAVGIGLAVVLDPRAFSIATGCIFLGLAGWMVRPVRSRGSEGAAPVDRQTTVSRWTLHPWLAAAAAFGGFVQVGVGILLLLVLQGPGRFSSVEANAIKVVLVLAWTLSALIGFSAAGLTAWPIGILVGLGGMLGAWIGARLLLRTPVRALRALVVVVLVVLGARFLIAV